MSVTCEICGAIIPNEVISHRRKTKSGSYCCSKECENERRKQEGLFKQMSVAGKDARSQAVTKSNSEHPRRKKQ